MRWRFWGLLVAAAVVVPVAPAQATVPVVVIDGLGFGHGVGMAQDGAYWMATRGATAPQILGHFYPGASLSKVAHSAVRVAVFTGTSATVAFPNGGRIDERATGPAAPGFPIRMDPGAQARLTWSNGRLMVDQLRGAHAPTPATTTTVALAATNTTLATRPRTTLLPLGTTTTTTRVAPAPRETHQPKPVAPPSTTNALLLSPTDGGALTVVDRQRTYRGVLDTLPTGDGFKLVNQLDIEHYLRGMGEMRDPTWPAAALRTQAVAARTYALRAMRAAGEICDGQRCQVYLGKQAEYAAMDKAVAATTGQVLTFNASLASAVYSSNGGGHSASREEGFGTSGGDYPYLQAVPYATHDPLPWAVTIGLTDVAARLAGGSPLTGVEVIENGPSGRALSVALDGPGGRRTVSGLAFARAFGLRSTMFSTRIATADVAPDAPAAGGVLQAPPDELATAEVAAPASAPLVARALDLPDQGISHNANAAAEQRSSTTALLVVLGVAVWAALAATRRRRFPVNL